MKKYIFLFTMFFALSLNLSAKEPPTQPVNTEQTATPEKVDSAPVHPAFQEEAKDSTVIIVPPNGNPTVDWLFSQANAIYMLLLYLLGWLSGFIPGLKKLDDKRLRMLILGLILAGAFTVWQIFQKDLNWQDFVGLVMAFVATQLGYQYILSPIPILKTPEPKTPPK